MKRPGGRRGSWSISGVVVLKMDFEEIVGASGHQARRGFGENSDLAELECVGPSGTLACHRWGLTLVEKAAKGG